MTTRRLARAKINLALHVTGQRKDGYHLLDSVVAFADCGDVITVAPADSLSLILTGPYAHALSSTDNLVLTAARALHPNRGAQITLEKNLPVASGIGGGSADAAATLLALSELWSKALPPAEIILKLGADLSICLHGKALRMQGIGEQITPLALPPLHAVLANPGRALATKDVFNALTQRQNPAMTPLPSPDHLIPWLAAQRNDLQPAAVRLEPQIVATLTALQSQPDCQLARMSGSGATCFGLFPTADQATAAALTLKTSHSHWWVQATTLT
ncbi:MAG: 4-(cytidine 5'-diphospho)-2-C-methyl-D-erythritol kinase [Candidatus Saccharibacteria bacterium]|nr:4-(cytidine 5'-diphospho)-2-C-methyl-D-erythritol kinase [Pseudorhodobacter sp.]